MRTGKIQIRNCRLGPGVFKFQLNVAAVIDVKTDLSTQDLVTLAFRNPRGDTKVQVRSILWPLWRSAHVFCTARSPLRLCPKIGLGVTLLPFRDFYIWGTIVPHRLHQCLLYSHTSRRCGRARHSSDGRRSRSCGALKLCKDHTHAHLHAC
jgi:hypothetical protein